MPSKQIAGTTAVVTGASRGLGRAVAAALCQAGAHVVGVARDARRLDEVRQQHGEAFTGIAAIRAAGSGQCGRPVLQWGRRRRLPFSGGYAGAKAAIRFITSYAADESVRAGLGIRFVSVLPNLIAATDLGAAAAIAYARRQGIDAASFVASRGPLLDAEQVGKMVVDLIAGSQYDKQALVTPGGLAGLD